MRQTHERSIFIENIGPPGEPIIYAAFHDRPVYLILRETFFTNCKPACRREFVGGQLLTNSAKWPLQAEDFLG